MCGYVNSGRGREGSDSESLINNSINSSSPSQASLCHRRTHKGPRRRDGKVECYLYGTIVPFREIQDVPDRISCFR